PGFHEAPADTACDQVMTSHGQPGVLASPDQFAGAVCNIVWMFSAALDHAPSAEPDQLAAGLQRAGSVPFAFPDGPDNFSAPGPSSPFRTDSTFGVTIRACGRGSPWSRRRLQLQPARPGQRFRSRSPLGSVRAT